MKLTAKTVFLLMLLGAVSVTVGIWFHAAMQPPTGYDWIAWFSLAFVILGAFFLAYKRLASERRGLSPEDELSRRIHEKAAARAFFWSLFMWTFGCAALVDSGVAADVVLGIGVIFMGLIYIFSWLYYNRMGIEGGHE